MQDEADIEPIDHADDELVDALATLRPRAIPETVAASFRERLAREPRRRNVSRAPIYIGLAATLALIAGAGWWHERQQRLTEETKMHSELTAALQSLSTGVRLTAIDATVRAGQHGTAVEEALITALLNDPNTNVRMAAADALGRIARPTVLRQAVQRAFAAEKSPFVQMTLLDAAGRLPIAERREAITPLLNRGDVDPMVASDARERVRDGAKGDSR